MTNAIEELSDQLFAISNCMQREALTQIGEPGEALTYVKRLLAVRYFRALTEAIRRSTRLHLTQRT